MSESKKSAIDLYAKLKQSVANDLLARLLLDDEAQDPIDCVLSVAANHLELFNDLAAPDSLAEKNEGKTGKWKYRWNCGHCPCKGMIVDHDVLLNQGATCDVCGKRYDYDEIAQALQCGHWYDND